MSTVIVPALAAMAEATDSDTARQPLRKATSSRFFSGLDLGKLSDYTAWIVVEQHSYEPPPEERIKVVPMEVIRDPVKRAEWLNPKKPDPVPLKQYHVRRVERYPKGTPYVEVCDRMVAAYSADALRGTQLAVDQTGVGEAVVEMLNKAFREARKRDVKVQAVVRPILITAGASVTAVDAGFHVAKQELVGVLHALFGNDQLKFGKSVQNVGMVKKELEAFREKATPAGNVTYGAWREKDHDDLVLSLAMALWLAERGTKQLWVR